MGVRLTFERPGARHAVARFAGASVDWKLALHKPYVYVNVKYFVEGGQPAECGNGSGPLAL
jgi:hypothetical protein